VLAIPSKELGGIDRTIGLFWGNSGCSAEQKTLGILIRTIPWKRKMLGIMYSEQKYKQTLGIPFRTILQKRKNALNSVCVTKIKQTLEILF
jgi:hypothetical protein